MMRILVLDDEPLISMMLQDWLADQGFDTVGPVHRTDAALHLIATQQIDAAMLDIDLGDHDSSQVAAALRDKDVPFIFLTGHSGEGVPLAFKGTPVATKPVDFVALKVMLSNLLPG